MSGASRATIGSSTSTVATVCAATRLTGWLAAVAKFIDDRPGQRQRAPRPAMMDAGRPRPSGARPDVDVGRVARMGTQLQLARPPRLHGDGSRSQAGGKLEFGKFEFRKFFA